MTSSIIYNDNNISDNEITRVVKRAKVLIENDNNEIAIAYSHNNYFFIGGHVENDEDDFVCLDREIKEETGISLPLNNIKRFFEIIYYNKDYPNKGDYSKYISTYYYLKYDLNVDMNNMNLTDDEIDGNFKVCFIDKDKILDVVKNSLKTCTRENVVKDTINVLEYYLNNRL